MMEEFLQSVSNWLLQLMVDWFGGNALYTIGVNIWNWAMTMCGVVATTTPDAFSSVAWAYTTNVVLDFTIAIGGTLLNVFFMVGIIRQSTNLKENFTLEIFVDNVIKVLLSNMLILNGLDLIKMLFRLSAISSGAFLIDNMPNIELLNQDIGSFLFNFIFGFVFLAVSIVCAFTIFLTLYNRYLQLYLLVATYPLAMSTLPGGHGVYNTASSWLKTFLGKTFEIVIIAMAVSIGSAMASSIDFGSVTAGVGAAFDGAIHVIQSMATMIIMTGAVKGVDEFMRRAFGL